MEDRGFCQESQVCVTFLLAVAKILELEDGQECVIIGTLYKDMILKPTILDEYTKEVHHSELPTPQRAVDFEVV